MSQEAQLGIGNIIDIARVIWRRRRIFGVAALLIFACAAAFIFAMPPRYRAESQILLPQMPLGTLGEGGQRLLVGTDPVTMRSEVDIIGNSAIARHVIDELDLAHDPEFMPPPPSALARLTGALSGGVKSIFRGSGAEQASGVSGEAMRADALLQAYRQRLSVFSDGRSLIVQIGFTAARPDLAQRVVNAHAQGYLDAQVERRALGQQSALQWLRTELDGRAKELRSADEAVQTYRASYNLIPVERAGQQRESLVDQELRQVNDALVGARNDVTREQSRLAQLDEAVRRGTAPPTSDIANSAVIVRLRQRESEANSTLARLKSSNMSGTVLNNAKAELDSIRDTLRDEFERLRAGTAASLKEAQDRAEMFGKRMEETTRRRISLDQAGVELKGLETYAAAKRSIYEIVLGRYNTLLSERGFNVADARIIAPATIPTRPTFPQTGLFLGIAALFSALVAAALAVSAEHFGGSIRSLRAHCRSLGVDVLGVVPIMAHVAGTSGLASQLKYRQFWESMRSIRNRVADTSDANGQVILITSAFPQEGKSVFAVSLARAYASIGMKTILIDGDLRRPSVASRVGVGKVSTGISEVLSSRVRLEDAIVATDRGNLALLPAAPGHEEQSDALATEKMAGMLRQLRRDYRIVVIDSPPLAAASDALSLATAADKTVVVARAGVVSNSSISEVVQMLTTHQASLAGLVLVGESTDEVAVGSKLGDYYGPVTTTEAQARWLPGWRRFAHLTGIRV